MKQKGFTLVELLVVIAIIGVLTTLAVAAVNVARNKAKVAKAMSDIDELYKAASIMANDTNQWPGHQAVGAVCSTGCASNEICGTDLATHNCGVRTLDAGISGLKQNDTATPYGGWAGPYIMEVPLDPWGQQYFFDTDYMVDVDNKPCNGAGGCVNAAVIGSYGPNGVGVLTGGAGAYDGDDIIKIITK